MTKLKPAPAEPSVQDAEAAVTRASAELNAIRTEMAATEGALPTLALDPDDTKFEEASLTLDRLKRSELRAAARLKQARASLVEAKARVEQDRRQSLYEAGQAACREAETLVNGEYKTHAAALAKVMSRLGELYAVVEAANDRPPDGTTWMRHHLDLDGFRHQPDRPPTTRIEFEGYYVDEHGHECAPVRQWDANVGKFVITSTVRTREKPVHVPAWRGTRMSPLTTGVKLPAAVHGEGAYWPEEQPLAKYHEPTFTAIESPAPAAKTVGPQTLANGARKFVMPPSDWGTAR